MNQADCNHIFEQIPQTNLAKCLRCGKSIFRENTMLNRKFFLTLLVLASLVFAACDPKKTRDAAEAAARMNRLVKNLVKATDESFDEKLISENTARKATVIFDKAIPLAASVTDTAENLLKKFPNGKISVSEYRELRDVFDALRVPLEDCLELFAQLSDSQRTKLDAAIEAIKAVIEIITAAFSSAEVLFREEKQWNVS